MLGLGQFYIYWDRNPCVKTNLQGSVILVFPSLSKKNKNKQIIQKDTLKDCFRAWKIVALPDTAMNISSWL